MTRVVGQVHGMGKHQGIGYHPRIRDQNPGRKQRQDKGSRIYYGTN